MEKNVGTRVACPFAACRYLLSQTYTPKPDTTQRNSKECRIPTGSHVHAGEAMTFSENNSKHSRYLRLKKKKKQANKIKEGLRTL